MVKFETQLVKNGFANGEKQNPTGDKKNPTGEKRGGGWGVGWGGLG